MTPLDLFRTEMQKPKGHRGAVATSQLSHFPDVLKIEKLRETDSAPPAVNYGKALQNAKDQDDFQTIFFIDFPTVLTGNALKAQRDLQEQIRSWRAWASTICEGKVQQQVDAGMLPGDNTGKFARGSYRAKVFDYLMRQSTWFLTTTDQNMIKHIEAKKADFHMQLLIAVLEGYSVPTSVFANLEKALSTISTGIAASASAKSESPQFWIMMTKYNWQPISQTVQAVNRIIQFRVGEEARIYSLNKIAYESVNFDLSFNQRENDFNEDVYAKIRDSIDNKLIQQGEELANKNSLEVAIPL